MAGTLSGDGGARLVVDTPLGRLAATAAESAPRAGACQVSIRPEAIVVANGDGGENRLTGVVSECLYLGEAVQLTVEVGGVKLRANVTERAGGTSLAVDGPAQVAIDPGDVVLLPA